VLTEADLDRSQAWFDRHGRLAVLIGRLAPLVRSLVSIPAGVTRMPLLTFTLYTAIGSALWNAVLIGAGWALGSRWREATELVERADVWIYVAVIAAVAAAFGAHRIRRARSDP